MKRSESNMSKFTLRTLLELIKLYNDCFINNNECPIDILSILELYLIKSVSEKNIKWLEYMFACYEKLTDENYFNSICLRNSNCL